MHPVLPLLAWNVRRPDVSLYHVYFLPSRETLTLKLKGKITLLTTTMQQKQ